MRLFDLLEQYVKPANKSDVLACKERGEWTTYSATQFVELVNELSLGLLALGIQAGDRVAIVADGRPEWNIVDFGIQQIGAVSVPIYPTMTNEDFQYIFHEAEVRLVFAGDDALYRKLNDIVATSQTVEELFLFDHLRGAKHWSEVTKKGASGDLAILEKHKTAVQPDDLLSIIYTSGTTGSPKGVMLTHHNVWSNVQEACKFLKLGVEARALSFLPLNHIYERMVQYTYLQKGISIYYAEGIETISENLREVRPQVFTTVPRLLEKVYDRIVTKGYEQTRIGRNVFLWALGLGLKYDPNRRQNAWYELQLKWARKLVFNKWKEALGGRVELVSVGAAALSPRIARVFWAAGIPVCEGYGLTETSPLVATNRLWPQQDLRIGTVGLALDNVQIKIAEDGEILVKGPNVMQGYYKQPALTAEVLLPDGWLHTGDIGELIEGKYLKITDRKKEIFKTSVGKYVAPQVVETKLKESFFVEQVVVVGDGQKYAAALVVPSFDALREWCKIESISFEDNSKMIENERVVLKIKDEIEKANQDLAPYERVKKFHLLAEPFSVENNQLTPSLKPKRRVIQAQYAAEIKGLFAK